MVTTALMIRNSISPDGRYSPPPARESVGGYRRLAESFHRVSGQYSAVISDLIGIADARARIASAIA
jgi:hypothetical protein